MHPHSVYFAASRRAKIYCSKNLRWTHPIKLSQTLASSEPELSISNFPAQSPPALTPAPQCNSFCACVNPWLITYSSQVSSSVSPIDYAPSRTPRIVPTRASSPLNYCLHSPLKHPSQAAYLSFSACVLPLNSRSSPNPPGPSARVQSCVSGFSFDWSWVARLLFFAERQHSSSQHQTATAGRNSASGGGDCTCRHRCQRFALVASNRQQTPPGRMPPARSCRDCSRNWLWPHYLKSR